MSMVDKRAAGLRIRVATASDSTLLAEVGAETFSDSFATENTPENMAAYLTESFGPGRQARELADAASRFLIIESYGVPVGYAHVRSGEAPPCIGGQRPMEIRRFYARKAWIGRGVGARLMKTCLQEAASTGCDVIWLDVWERNGRAITFYRRWGFTEVGTQSFRLGDDLQQDLLMARAVDSALA